MEQIVHTPEDLPAVAKKFVALMGDNRIFALYGDMGAGKTTFIKAVCEALGVKDVINSPTFAIVNEYSTGNGRLVYHFDFYRIRKKEEAFDFGYEEYIYSDAICFIEWPELIEDLLPEESKEVRIRINPDGSRTICLDE